MNTQDLLNLAQSEIPTSQEGLRKFKLDQISSIQELDFDSHSEYYDGTPLARFLNELDPKSSADHKIETSLDEITLVDGKLTHFPQMPGMKVSPLPLAYLEKLKKDRPLSALHHGLMSAGLLIEISKNTKIEKPIKISHVIEKSSVVAPVIWVEVGENSSVSILEKTYQSNQTYFHLGETYIHVLSGAQCEHVQIDLTQEKSLNHNSTYALVNQDASYKNFIFHLEGKLNRRNLEIDLTSPGANGESYALFLTDQEEHSDIFTVINHLAPDTTSNQVAKGILGGKSKGIFTGKIHIHPKAQRVKSGQINRNLLLSEKAQVNSRPQLEIFADDVKCSHGSTTGQLSQDEFFYFESRGIPASRARNLLAFGFGLEVVLKIENTLTSKIVKELVGTTLMNKYQIGEQS
jgi:Fe-S cluster assembly protein SufD